MGILSDWRQALVDADAGASKVKTLVRVIRAGIDSGTLRELQRLPSQRQAARALGISGQTMTNAYQELERQGLIRCEIGRGSYVARRVAKNLTHYILDEDTGQPADLSTARILHTEQHIAYWQETCRALAAETEQPWLFAARPMAGLLPQREAACDWMGRYGVRAAPKTLMLTNGATQAVYLALASVAGSGDLVACDRLTDHGVIGAAQTLGFTLHGLESDAYGIRPDDFEDLCSNQRVTALAVTPNLNNPTASVMSASRRRAIAAIAARHGVYVVEDDACAALLQPGSVTPLAHAIPDLAFYCTTLTKSLMAALRVGMLLTPETLFARTEHLLRIHSWMNSSMLGEIATRWIRDGKADVLAAVQRELIGARQQQVQQMLQAHLIGWHPQALVAWLAVPAQWNAPALIRHLHNLNVRVTPADPFAVPGCAAPAAFRIAVGAPCSDVQWREALERIAQTLAHTP